MAYSYPEIKKFDGLFLQANSFTVPDGAMEIAKNIVISKDGIASKRRGFYEYYDPGNDVLNNLFVYDTRLLAVFSDKIGYFTDTGTSPNETGTRTVLSGATVAVTGDRVSRSILSNRNLYFTTDNGILKLDSYDGTIYKSGTPQALDLRGQFYGSSGPIANNMLVGWRLVFGRRDANDNLILGAPSEIFTLTNTGGTSVNTRLEASIPSEISSASDGYFFRLYRSSQVASSSNSIFSDFKLIDERVLTSAEISAGVLFYNDDIDDILLGEELYTNQNSREGEDQANYRAPKSEDMTIYKGHAIYGNCVTRHVLNFNVIDSSVMASLDFIEVKVDSTVRRYVARTGVSNKTVSATSITNAAGNLQIDYTAHNLSNFTEIYIDNITGGSLTAGTYYVLNTAANSFEIATSITGSSVTYSAVTALDFQGVRARESTVSGVSWTRTSNVATITSTAHGLSTGMAIYVSGSSGGSPDVSTGLYTITVTNANAFTIASVGADDGSGNTLNYAPYQPLFALDTTSSASVQLSTTARGIVKAINRDEDSLVYATYASGINEIPGMMRLQAKSFTGTIYVRGNDSTTGGGFSPTLPDSFSTGTQVYSFNDQLPHVFFSAKFNEPEAVPIVNQFPVGARNKEILRVLALRDSMIVIKEDGVFRVTGDTVSNFQVTTLDATVVCVAPSSATVLNNQVVFLSNQGVCLVTETSVQIISRKIEDVIQPILGTSTLSAQTGSFSYESERFYGISTLQPNGTTAGVSYVYNILNDTWVSWDAIYKQGVVGPDDVLYLIAASNSLVKERKTQTRLDFTAQNYPVTINSVASGNLSAEITMPVGVVPEVGDVLVKSSVFSRITSVTLVSGVIFTVTFARETNLAAADSVQLYSYYESQIKMSPFHAGLVGRMKQFAQMQLHFRDNNVSALDISFSGDTFGSSELTTWESQLTAAGWGEFPWGFEPWGQEDGINTPRSTNPAPICRLYVPRFQQRGTYIQPLIIHKRAGEAINLQAMSFSVRAYNERVSR